MLTVSRRETERYLGYRGISSADPETGALIDACIREIQKCSSPRSLSKTFPLVWYPDSDCAEACEFAGIRCSSNSLLRNLKDCDEVVLLAVTLGTGPDMLIRRASLTDTMKACVLQAAGAAAVESWCDEVNEAIRKDALEKGLYARPRFSPGYGDFPLEAQRGFENALQMKKNIGISLTDSCMMIPEKSITAVIGLSKIERQCRSSGCEECTMAGSCEYSRTGRRI